MSLRIKLHASKRSAMPLCSRPTVDGYGIADLEAWQDYRRIKDEYDPQMLDEVKPAPEEFHCKMASTEAGLRDARLVANNGIGIFLARGCKNSRPSLR
jgi:hypothetical protein